MYKYQKKDRGIVRRTGCKERILQGYMALSVPARRGGFHHTNTATKTSNGERTKIPRVPFQSFAPLSAAAGVPVEPGLVELELEREDEREVEMWPMFEFVFGLVPFEFLFGDVPLEGRLVEVEGPGGPPPEPPTVLPLSPLVVVAGGGGWSVEVKVVGIRIVEVLVVDESALH